MENKLHELLHASRSRLRHRSSAARGIIESQAGKKTKTAQHSVSESRQTQGNESSKVCSRGDQQVYGIGSCTEWGNPRRSLERSKNITTVNSQRNDGTRQIAKKEIDIWFWWDFRSNQGKNGSKRQRQKPISRTEGWGTQKAQSG